MQDATIPPNEAHRLRSLHRYHILDTVQEAVFDELVDLAATICEAPIALISLVDQSRQWFKARIGLEEKETARSVSFCAHAILQPNLFVVPDTLTDQRFVDNPLVTGPPNIRFYAGAPLFTEEGLGLGTLCVIDRVPRQLSPIQEKALMVLRTHVLKLLELRLKTRELAEVNRELETYSYTVSHDLRAPLRAISGFSEILVEDHAASLDDEARTLVTRIQDATRRMQQLTDDLLYLSHIVRMPFNLARTDLSKLAVEVISELTKTEPNRHVDFDIQPDIIVDGDPNLLRVVLENLLGNAWKYTSKRDRSKIAFGRERVNGSTAFYVRDNGAGFEMAYARKLFEPFQRLHSSSDYSGTGIGLATVKRIIQRHEGTIWAEAYVDQGATFRFTLLTETSS
jgi:signal transduction histidine kinase